MPRLPRPRAILLTLATLALLPACASDGSLVRDDLSEREIADWNEQVKQEKGRIHTELHDLRAQLKSRRATVPHLWRVTSPKGRVSYILGSMHRHVRWTSFPRHVHDCLERAHVIAFEIDLDREPTSELEDAAAGSTAATEPRASSSGGPAWSRYRHEMRIIRPELYASLAPTEALALYGLVKDSFLTSIPAQMDLEILAEARRAKKRLAYLETNADRLPVARYLLSTPQRVSVKDFRALFTSDPLAYYIKELRADYEIAVAYRQGDDKRLEGIVTSDVYDPAIRQRNEAWLPRVERLVDGAPALVVVGTGHLMGPAALDKLLTKAGYATTRVDRCD
jgi:uncharacterized protein YbaP (TraB family)